MFKPVAELGGAVLVLLEVTIGVELWEEEEEEPEEEPCTMIVGIPARSVD